MRKVSNRIFRIMCQNAICPIEIDTKLNYNISNINLDYQTFQAILPIFASIVCSEIFGFTKNKTPILGNAISVLGMRLKRG